MASAIREKSREGEKREEERAESGLPRGRVGVREVVEARRERRGTYRR